VPEIELTFRYEFDADADPQDALADAVDLLQAQLAETGAELGVNAEIIDDTTPPAADQHARTLSPEDCGFVREPFLDHKGDYGRAWTGVLAGTAVTVCTAPSHDLPAWCIQHDDSGAGQYGDTFAAALAAAPE
jgi:hypothetical protein